jgi:hypothetical protein
MRLTVSSISAPTYHLPKYLAGLLGSYTGSNSPYHVRNFTDFVGNLDSLHVSPHDIMISFDVVLLFTRVLIKETMDLLG